LVLAFKAPEAKAEVKAPEIKGAVEPVVTEPKVAVAKAVEPKAPKAKPVEAKVAPVETPVAEPVMVAPAVEPAAAPAVKAEAAPLVATTVDAPPAMSRPLGLAAARQGGADDLKLITGVGPKIEMVLNDLGIFHFSQIAGWSAADSDAIGTFIETLLTPGAPFDRWLSGEDDALDADQLGGYRLFKSFGCIACHHGVAVGGNMVQTFGVMGDYFVDRGNITTADLGRFNVTQRDEDRHRFKVPSLRNVALTAPYFHDGSAADLAQAVRVMAYYQLGRKPAEDDVRLIVAFLESLTGTWQGDPLGRRPAKGR
jgi:predicted flap endonuclease-1-like 5' DNA nuclease